MRGYFTPVKIAIVKKTRNKWWQGFGEKRILPYCQWEHKSLQHNENSMQFSQKTENRTIIQSCISTPEYISKENKNTN